MRKYIFSLMLSFVPFFTFAQNITLQELQTLILKNNWKEVDTYLNSIGWEYFDSKKNIENKELSNITWSFKKNEYSNKAQGWLILVTDENTPCRIIYEVFNKTSYNSATYNLNGLGFVAVQNNIGDGNLVSNFVNAYGYLSIQINKKDNDNDNDNAPTAWTISITKKGSILDKDNGKRIEYHTNGNKSVEYSLKDGQLNGQFRTYYEDGNLQTEGYVVNGLKNGKFKEYHTNGSLKAEYMTKNDKAEGEIKIFHENGKIKEIYTKINEKINGKVTVYFEDGVKMKEYTKKDDKYVSIYTQYDSLGRKIVHQDFGNGNENIKYKRLYYEKNENKHWAEKIGILDAEERKQGKWYAFKLEKGKIIDTLQYENFVDDKRNGFCKIFEGNDSLVVAEYKEGILDGKYTLFMFRRSWDAGGKVLDVYKIKEEEGFYVSGKKNGKWTYYQNPITAQTGILETIAESLKREIKLAEGYYEDDKRTGKWSYYYGNNILQTEEEYQNDLLHGKVQLHFIKKEIPTTDNVLGLPANKIVYYPTNETIYFAYGKKNGKYTLLDSTKTLLASGNFQDDLRNGHWIEYELVGGDTAKKIKPEIHYNEGKYVNGKVDGEWIYYKDKDKVLITLNYSLDKLNGKITFWNDKGKPKFIRYFLQDKFIGLDIYDESGDNIIRKYEILQENKFDLKCNYTNFSGKGKYSQIYWVKKDKDTTNFRAFDKDFLEKLSRNNTNEIYPDGKVSSYSPEGKILFEGIMSKNQRIDGWVIYDYTQKVLFEAIFSNNISNPETEKYTLIDNNTPFSGKYIYLDKDNNITEERKIKNGKRDGKTYYIDSKGKTTKKESYKLGVLQK